MPARKGPRPDQWKTGPDPVTHEKYVAWLRSKAQASFRKEQWDLSFDQWQQLWGDSWCLRGRRQGNLMLMRRDWHQPWSADNCFLGTRDNYHYQQLQRKQENGTIQNINRPRPENQP